MVSLVGVEWTILALTCFRKCFTWVIWFFPVFDEKYFFHLEVLFRVVVVVYLLVLIWKSLIFNEKVLAVSLLRFSNICVLETINDSGAAAFFINEEVSRKYHGCEGFFSNSELEHLESSYIVSLFCQFWCKWQTISCHIRQLVINSFVCEVLQSFAAPMFYRQVSSFFSSGTTSQIM